MLATKERAEAAKATVVAFGYARVSTQAQNTPHNVSLDTQRARIGQYCASKGFSLAQIYVDVESGRRDERKAYREMVGAALRGQAGVIIVQFLDRLGRHPKELLRRVWELEDAGVGVEATDEDLGEEMMLLMRAGFAGAESRRISERVMANMRNAVSKGVHVGSPPFGLVSVYEGPHKVRWEIEPREALIVREMVRLRVEGNLGYLAVAKRLTALGHATRRGGRWTPEGVKQVLTGSYLIGQLVYGRKGKRPGDLVVVDGFFPAILSADEWAKLQERESLRAGIKGRAQVSDFLLSTMVRCAHCGGPMIGQSGSKTSYGRYRRYVCSNKIRNTVECPQRAHEARALEKAVLEYLGQFSDPQKVRALLATSEVDRAGELAGQLKRTISQIQEMEKDFHRNVDLVKREMINEEEFKRLNEATRDQRTELESRRADLEREVSAVRNQEALVGRVPHAVASFMGDMQGLEPREAKAALQTILKAVHVSNDGRLDVEFRTS